MALHKLFAPTIHSFVKHWQFSKHSPEPPKILSKPPFSNLTEHFCVACEHKVKPAVWVVVT